MSCGFNRCVFNTHHSGPCQEILLWYLGHADRAQLFPVLRGLCSLGGQLCRGASELHFTPGSGGGARLAPRMTDRWVLPVFLPVCLSVCLSICLYVCMSAFLFVSACLPVCLSVCPSACLSIFLYVCLSACLPVCLSVPSFFLCVTDLFNAH